MALCVCGDDEHDHEMNFYAPCLLCGCEMYCYDAAAYEDDDA